MEDFNHYKAKEKEKTGYSPQTPHYTISFDAEHAIQFHPPLDSRELGIALSLQFPQQPTMKEELQAAMMAFLREDQRVSEPPEPDDGGAALSRELKLIRQECLASNGEASNGLESEIPQYSSEGSQSIKQLELSGQPPSKENKQLTFSFSSPPRANCKNSRSSGTASKELTADPLELV